MLMWESCFPKEPERKLTPEEIEAQAEARLQETIDRINAGRTPNQMTAKLGLRPVSGKGERLFY